MKKLAYADRWFKTVSYINKDKVYYTQMHFFGGV